MYRRYIRTNLQIVLEEACKYCLLNTFSIMERYCNFCVFCMLHGDLASYPGHVSGGKSGLGTRLMVIQLAYCQFCLPC